MNICLHILIRVIVALDTKVYVYDFENLHLIDQFDTSPNINGLLAVCPLTEKVVYATPATSTGMVRIDIAKSEVDMTGKQSVVSTEIKATESQVAQIAIDQEGRRMAVTSQRGTIVRVYDIQKKELIDEFRRGSNSANVQCLAFSPDSTLLALTSDHGSVHIFQVQGENCQSRYVNCCFTSFQSQTS